MSKSIGNENGLVRLRTRGEPREATPEHVMDLKTRMMLAVELRRARTSAGLTQSELGRLSGVSGGQISHMELGRRSGELETWQRLFRQLGRTIVISLEHVSDEPAAVET